MVEQVFHNIESARLLLRRFNDVDLEPFHAYRSDPTVEKYQGWGVVTREDSKQFIAAVKNSNPGKPGDRSQIAIELLATGAMIGDLYLHVLEDEPQQAEIGYSLAREHQGQGYATEAVTALIDYVFSTLNLHRVRAGADCENLRSIALLERIGMRREGHMIQNEWYRGKWTDENQYAVLKSECRKLKQAST